MRVFPRAGAGLAHVQSLVIWRKVASRVRYASMAAGLANDNRVEASGARRAVIAVSSMLLVATACARDAPLKCPAEGGKPWLELTSKHYVMRTDLGASDAEEALEDFERVYSSIEDLWAFHDVGNAVVAFEVRDPTTGTKRLVDRKPSGRIEIVLFDSRAEFREFDNRSDGSFTMPDDWDPLPSVVTYADSVGQLHLTLQHEIAHRFIRFYYPQAPTWLSEGLASYYGALQIKGGRAWLGLAPYQFGIPAVSAIPSASRLLASDSQTFYLRNDFAGQWSDIEIRNQRMCNYAGAHALVQLLKNGGGEYRRRWQNYLFALVEARSAQEAWQKAYGDLPMERLEEDYQALLSARDRAVLTVAYEPHVAKIDHMRTMRPAEVHRLRARLLRRGPAVRVEEVQHEIDAALHHEPHDPEAIYLSARLSLMHGRAAVAEQRIREAMRLDPAEPRYALMLFVMSLPRFDGVDLPDAFDFRKAEELAATLAKMPPDTAVLNDLAWYDAIRGRTAAGLQRVTRAIYDAPACAPCYDTYALLLFLQGQAALALRAETIAIGLFSEHGVDPAMLDRLRIYRSAAESSTVEGPSH